MRVSLPHPMVRNSNAQVNLSIQEDLLHCYFAMTTDDFLLAPMKHFRILFSSSDSNNSEWRQMISHGARLQRGRKVFNT